MDNAEPVDSSTDLIKSRLGKCEVCNYNDAKYTCPKCEVKTCCLNCLKIHKKELNCDGIRDRTKYIPLSKMTNMDFMNDYYFLEECTRYVEDRKHDKIKRFTRYNRSLPGKLFKLRNAAQQRKVTLKFLLDNFSKHKINTTYFNQKENTIYWRVEWIFLNAENLKYVDEKCSENYKISILLDKYLNKTNKIENTSIKTSLEYYQSKGLGNIKVLLKSEGIKKCKNRFFLLDCNKTLKENLIGKTIVEFPIIYLCCGECIDEIDIIDSDEDVETETKEYYKELNEMYQKTKQEEKFHEENENIKIKKENKNLEEINMKKKCKHKKIKVEPKNYLFTDENLLNELSSGSDDDNNETPEEGKTILKKIVDQI